MTLLLDKIVAEVEVVSNISSEDLDYIVSKFEDNRIEELEIIGRGSYSVVYGYNDYAIKVLSRGRFKEGSKCNDVQVLKDLSHIGCIPKLHAVINNKAIIVDRVKGLTVEQHCINGRKNDKIEVNSDFHEKWKKGLLEIVASGYSPDDVHEANVMIEEGTNEPKIIDVGWFYKHGKEYGTNAIEELELMRSDIGYSRAQMWAGSHIEDFLRRKERQKLAS